MRGLQIGIFSEILSVLGDEFPIVHILSGCTTIVLIIVIVRYFIKNK